ncbi:unnamed protein product [Camellia sinensis]
MAKPWKAEYAKPARLSCNAKAARTTSTKRGSGSGSGRWFNPPNSTPFMPVFSKEIQSNASDDECYNESNPMPLITTKPSKLNVVHGVREKENYVKQYRSSIVSLINLMRDTKFTETHITTLERTPFGMLFKSFWKKRDVRRFRNMSRISVKSLREALGDALEGTTTVDVEDVARIMCLFVVATLLLPTIGLTVGWAFVALVEDLEMMNSYAWSTAVASTLTTSIHSSLGSPENVTGYVLLLAPSMRLINVEEKANEEVIANIKARRGVNHYELKPISKEEMDLIRNDEEEDALDMEENLETKEDENHVAGALEDAQPLKDFIDLGKLERVQKESKRLKSENMALVEELKKMRETIQKIQEDQEAKTNKMMEKISNTEKEMEKLRKEFEVLKSENKQLVDQIEENTVHVATQAFASKEMLHAKGVRKKKEMSDFECEPREAKKKKTTKQVIEVISNEMIYVDNLPLSQPKPVERVLFPDKAAICKLCDENDKCLLNKIYNLETTDAIIWSGTRNRVYVTLHDVDAILRDGDTANNVIDNFVEMLQIEQEAKKPEKNKSFFFSSFCWSLVKWEKPYHWTLLIVTYVENKLANKTKRGRRKFANLVSVKDSPQQRLTS